MTKLCGQRQKSEDDGELKDPLPDKLRFSVVRSLFAFVFFLKPISARFIVVWCSYEFDPIWL